MTVTRQRARSAGDADLLEPLIERLLAVRPFLVEDTETAPVRGVGDPGGFASMLFDQAVSSVRAAPSADRLWLLLTAVAGAYPVAGVVEEAQRVFALESSTECQVWMLSAMRAAADADGRQPARRLRVVSGQVLVNVDHTAKNDLHTGVQRVVRETLPIWAAGPGVLPVAWHDDLAGFRELTPQETRRTVAWGRTTETDAVPDGVPDDAPDAVPGTPDLLVPWRCVLVLVDVDQAPALRRLVAIARFSGTACVGVGYDCIPVVSADLVPWGGAGRFTRYLELVKHMHRIAAISASARAEFQGFADALPVQGLVGPRVVECALPSVRPSVSAPAAAGDMPLVTAVGSYEPRKNQLALLHAAEVLWREGIRFRVRLIGGMSWDTEVHDRIDALHEIGRSVESRHSVSEQELLESYGQSRVTVFASLHEGYGLPVAESLAAGTPVIASAYGSTAEIGAGGGVVLVDPRDDGQLCAALRSLLTDDHRIEQLRAEIAHRSDRTWQHYADELWSSVVAPELARVAS